MSWYLYGKQHHCCDKKFKVFKFYLNDVNENPIYKHDVNERYLFHSTSKSDEWLIGDKDSLEDNSRFIKTISESKYLH